MPTATPRTFCGEPQQHTKSAHEPATPQDAVFRWASAEL